MTDPASTPAVSVIGGTSAAAPLVTGVVATLQALNPSLNPATPSLTAAQRRAIVASIKELITADENTFSNAELRSRGNADQPVERRRLIRPLAAAQAAAAPWLPDLPGYDVSLGFSEAVTPNDTPDAAQPLALGGFAMGTLLQLPGAASGPADEDWFAITLPELAGSSPVRARLELTFPASFGGLGLEGDGVHLLSRGSLGSEQILTYAVVAEAGTTVPFVARAGLGDDNVYRVTWVDAEPALPTVTLLSPPDAATVCADAPVNLVANATFPLSPSVVVPASALSWTAGSTSLGGGYEQLATFGAGTHSVTVTAYGAEAAADSVTFTAVDCAGEPPAVVILSPEAAVSELFYAGYDEALGLWYADVLAQGQGTDPEDGILPGSALTWYTDRTDLQAAELGSGTGPTLRLYGDDCFGVTHTVRLEGLDSDGNPAAPRTVQIFIYTLC